MTSDLRETLEEAYASADLQSSEPLTLADDENNNSEFLEPEEVIPAPNSYKQEFKDSFSSLSPEWQKYLSAREKEVEQGLSRARNQYSWVDKAYNDRKDYLSDKGFSSAQDYFSTLLNVADSLDKDPAGTISELQSLYGVDAADNDNPLQRQVAELQKAFALQQGYLQTRENERVRNELNSFIVAKDDKGNSLHAYFEEVKPEMIKLLQSGIASDLEDAYTRAVWQVPSIRDKMIADRASAGIAQKTAIAQKAKIAAFDPCSKAAPLPKTYSLREILEKNYDNLGE